jgi:hypothetical protein
MNKLTFKEYYESKQQPLEALKRTPEQEVQYVVRKYCKIPLGESKEGKEYVSLKPKQTIVVRWLYEDIEDPTPLQIRFQGAEELENMTFETFWSSEKLDSWLSRNARELF